jgi:uncharacterized protein (TIGR02646 family)
MKHVVKGPAPESFKAWKKKNPTAAWEDFTRTTEYVELSKTLLSEQKKMCCYCELALIGNGEAHIEHHRPKSSDRKLEFAVENLFACCQHKDSCGHNKGRSTSRIVSPSDADCEKRFTYTGSGSIIPVDENDETAYTTRKILGLDCKRLRSRRESIIKILDTDAMTLAEFDDSLTNCNEWYGGFYTVIEYVKKKRFP